MNIKELIASLLAKGFATVAEKAYVQSLVKELSDDEAEEVAEDVDAVDALDEEAPATDEDEDEDEEIDEEAVKALVSGTVAKEAQDAVAKAMEKASNDLVGKFMKGVKKARKTVTTASKARGQFSESREFFKALFMGDSASLKASGYLDTGTDATAGYLVPPAEFIAEVYRVADLGYGIARKDMRYIPKTGAGNQITVPALGSTVNVFWTDEGAAKTSTEPSFNLPTITLKKLAAIVPWTDEFGDDIGVNVVQLLAELFAEALAKQEDIAFFIGDGTGSFGGFTGVLNNGSVNTTTMSGTTFASMDADDLLDMQDDTPAGGLNGGKYYMHRSILSVVRKLKDNEGNYIYQSPGAGQPATVWNYPVEIVEAMPAIGDSASDTPFVLFGNLSQTCIISDKGTLAMKIFDSGVVQNVGNTNDLNLITQDMQAMRVVRRVGFVVALPSAVTVLKTANGGS